MENKSSKAVLAQAERDIQEEASTKSTLNSLNTAFSYRNVHECLAMVENPNQVTRSNIKCRLLVDVYPIQTVMLRTRQTKSDICTLCNMKQAEDRVHFILVCPALQTVRDKYLCRLQEVVPELKYLCVTKHEIVSKNLNLKLIIEFFHLLIIPMTLFNDIMPYLDELIMFMVEI